MRVLRRQAVPWVLWAAGSMLVAGGCRKERPRPAPVSDAGAGARSAAPVPAAASFAFDPIPAPARPSGGAAPGPIRVQLDAEPPHLDPLGDAHHAIAQVVEGTIYQTLLSCGRDGYQPGLADAWETSPDGLRLSLHLRTARWHDDRPFGPLDVQASLERVLRSSSPLTLLRAQLTDVESVEPGHDRTVRLRLLRPSGYVLRALCDVPILPEHLLRAGSAALASLGRQPVGTGPFRLVAWERGRRIRLSRAHGSGPTQDELVFEVESDPARALARIRRGEIDILPHVLDAHFPDQVQGPAMRERVRVHRLAPERFSFLVVNHKRETLADPRLRRALSLLWDRPRLGGELRHGLARAIALPPFITDGAPAGIAAPATPAFDPAAAVAILEQAGFRDSDGDGVRDRGGVAIRFTLILAAGARTAALEARSYAMDLRRVGLLLDVVPLEAGLLATRLAAGEFDLAPLLWEGRPDEDPRPLLGPQGPFNHGAFRSDRLLALLDELRSADGPRTRQPLLGRLGAFLTDETPLIFLYRHDGVALVARRVHGYRVDGDRFDLTGAWADPLP